MLWPEYLILTAFGPDRITHNYFDSWLSLVAFVEAFHVSKNKGKSQALQAQPES
jgi:hypothetical protein